MRAWRTLTAALLPLALRHLSTHRAAATIAGLAIATAVATLVATQLLYEGVVTAYEDVTRDFAGRAALQVTNGESGVPEELTAEIRRIQGVRAVAASVEGFVGAADLAGERLYLYGIDLLADQDVRSYGAGKAVVPDPLVFLASPDSVAVTTTFMRAHHLRLDDPLRLLTPAGTSVFTIRAALGPQSGPASAFDGRIAIVDLSVAQELLGLVGRVSQLAVTIDAAADPTAVERAVTARVGARGVVERPKTRVAAFARLLRNYRYGLLLAATVAAVVAVYFVFTLATIAVEERRHEIGLLRTVGMSRAGAASLLLTELLTLGSSASAAGIPLGLALAQCLTGSVGSTVTALYGAVAMPAPHLGLRVAILGLALGTSATVVAAIHPLARTWRVPPLAALRVAAAVGSRQQTFVMPACCGVFVAVVAVMLWAHRNAMPMSIEAAGMTTMLATIAGIAFIVPAAIRLLAAGAERLAHRHGGAVPLLATRAVTSEIGPVSIGASAALVGLAGTIAIATWMASLTATLDAAFAGVFGSTDLVVSAGAEPFTPEATRIPGPVADDVAAVDGVDAVDAIRVDTIAYGGSLASLVAADVAAYAAGRRRLAMVDGDAAAAVTALASGTSAVVNQTFARRFGHGPGDVIELSTPEGPLRLTIAGIYLELTPGDLPAIHVDRGVYRRFWRDDAASVLAITLRRPADRRRVATAIRARFGARHELVVLTLDELRREYRAMLNRLAGLVFPLLGCGALVALVGVASARAAALLARTRAAAVLRTIGATSAQLTATCVVEGALLGGVAAVFGAAAGSVLGRVQVDVLMRGMMGMSVLYAYPRGVAIVGGATVMLLTTGVGWLFGRRTARAAGAASLRWE